MVVRPIAADMSLDLRPDQLDGIQFGAIGRHEEEPHTRGGQQQLQRSLNPGGEVHASIVQHQDVTGDEKCIEDE